jgi:phage-related protein
MVHIYDKHTEQNAFDSNGIAIINPQSATITEELNGRYDYQLTAVCDPNDDSWRKLQVYNIIKSATTGQLFMIYKVRFDSSGGYPTVTAFIRS